MAKRDQVKNRLEYYQREKFFLQEARACPERWRESVQDPAWRKKLIADPSSLKRAAEYYGLNSEDTADLTALVLILADVVFGKWAEPGRPRGDGDALLRLGLYLYDLEKQTGRLSDTAAAKRLCEMPGYRGPVWESLRKQLPAARRKVEEVRAEFRVPIEKWAPIFLRPGK